MGRRIDELIGPLRSLNFAFGARWLHIPAPCVASGIDAWMNGVSGFLWACFGSRAGFMQDFHRWPRFAADSSLDCNNVSLQAAFALARGWASASGVFVVPAG